MAGRINIPIKAVPEGVKDSVREYQSLFDQIKKEAKSVSDYIAKLGFTPKTGGNPLGKEAIATQKTVLALKAAEERAERAVQLAKLASLNTERAAVKLAQEKARLERQTAPIQPRPAQPRPDTQFARAQADIRRHQQQTIAGERALTRQIEREAEQQFRAKTNAQKRAASDILRSLKQVEAEERRVASESAKLSSGGGLRNSAIGSFLGNVGAQAIAQVTSSFVSGAAAVLDYSSQIEQARIGFVSLTGSAAGASAHLEELQNFAKKTPFEFTGLVRASQLLQGVGIEGNKIVPILTDVGNRLAAAGKGNEEIQRTILALSQIATKGKLAGQEINQLAENGIPAVAILAQALGKPKEEILKLGEQGRISFELLIDAIHKTNEENNIGGAMEAQSHTFRGATENIKDSLLQLAEKAFQPLYKEYSQIADKLAVEIGRQDADFHEIGKAIGTAIGSALTETLRFLGRAIVAELKAEIEDVRTGAATLPFGLSSVTGIPGSPDDFIKRQLFGQQRADAQTRRLLDKIQRDKKEDAQNYFQKSLAVSTIGATLPKGALVLSRQGNEIKYIDAITHTVKTLTAAVDKVPSLTDKLLPGKEKKPGAKKKNVFDEIEAIGTNLDFIATSKYRPGGPNGPTAHAGKGAVDFGVNTNNKKTLDEWTRLIIAGLTQGKQVIDERLVGYHPGIKGSKNVHLGNSTNRSLFLPQSYYSVPVDYLKQLDAKRKSQKGLNVDTAEINRNFTEDIRRKNEEAQRKLVEQSDSLTKARDEADTRLAVGISTLLRIMPDEGVIRDYNALLVETARKAGTLQPLLEDTAKQFAGFAPAKTELPDTPITARTLSRSEQRFYDQNKELGLLPDDDGSTPRQLAAAERIKNILSEVATLNADYLQTLEDQTIENEVQLQLTQQRNTALESALGFAQSITEQARQQKDIDRDITTLAEQNANTVFVALRRNLSARQEEFDIKRSITALDDRIANGGINDALIIQEAHLQDILALRNKERDAVISINRSQLELSKSQEVSANQIRARVLGHLAAQKTLNESIADGIIGVYDKAADKIDKILDKSIGKIPILGDVAKNFARNSLTNLTKGLLDSVLPKEVQATLGLNKTGNPVLDEAKTQTGYLKTIANNTGGGAGDGAASIVNSFNVKQSGESGGGIAGFLQKLFGGGASGGTGLSNPSVIKNFTGLGAASGNLTPQRPDISKLLNLSSSGGGIFDSFKKIFSGAGGSGLKGITGKGGIFGADGFGSNVGTYSTIGAGAGILGGLISSKFGGSAIGRRAGGALSGGGSGLALGAQIGALFGPAGVGIGALIGGIGGAILGFFGAGGQRKKDEQARSQYRNDAQSALDKLISDTRSNRISGDAALSQAASIHSQYVEAASAIKDNKTRRIALNEYNPPNVLWAKEEELKKAAEAASANNERYRRLIPEFASGTYISSSIRALRYNGQIGGAFDGRDSLLARLSHGEMVLNPSQISGAIRRAGFDIFDGIVPNYKTQTPKPQTNFAVGGFANASAAPIVIEPKIIFENVEFNSDSKVWMESDDGKRVLVDVIKELKKVRRLN